MGNYLVTGIARTVLYLGVAVLRIYPLLNSRGVTFLQAVFALGTKFPLAAAALGAAAVEPAGELRAADAKFLLLNVTASFI